MNVVKNPLVSVIIPVYNVEKYLDKCIKSVVGQKYSNLEIILVDDGSTDKSSVICDDWAKKDSRIIVFHQINKGVSIARNVALSHMKGDFFTCVDPDDFLDEKYVFELVHMQKEFSVDIVFCGLISVDENGKQIAVLSRKREVVSGAKKDDVVWGKKGYCIGGVCKLIKSSIVKEHAVQYNPNLKNGEDWLFLRDCLFYSKKIASVGLNLYYYVQRTNSASSNFRKQFSTSLLQLWKMISAETQERIWIPWNNKKIEIATNLLIEAHLYKYFSFDEYNDLVKYVKQNRTHFFLSKVSFLPKIEMIIKLYFYKEFAFFKALCKRCK